MKWIHLAACLHQRTEQRGRVYCRARQTASRVSQRPYLLCFPMHATRQDAQSRRPDAACGRERGAPKACHSSKRANGLVCYRLAVAYDHRGEDRAGIDRGSLSLAKLLFLVLLMEAWTSLTTWFYAASQRSYRSSRYVCSILYPQLAVKQEQRASENRLLCETQPAQIVVRVRVRVVQA